MILLVGNALALVAAAVFIGVYSRTRWESTPVGMGTMAVKVALLLWPLSGMLRRTGHDHGADVLLSIAYPLVAVVLTWRTVQVVQAMRVSRDHLDHHAGEHR